MTSSFSIRTARETDLDAISVLAGQLVRQHHLWDPGRFMLIEPVEKGYRQWLPSQLADPSMLILVAETEGQVAGYLYGGLEPRDWKSLRDASGFVHDLAVSPVFRRKGIARALMLEAMARLKANGATQVGLCTAVQNSDAQALFTALGFRSTLLEMTFAAPQNK